MGKVIINADDCGISLHVDSEIRRFIENGLISSTTVMTNMEDFEGAIKLYEEYHDRISFGIHFNLTEGTPLCYSQLLLDSGYYADVDGKLLFNERNFDYRNLTKEIKSAIKIELAAQVEKLLDCGIKPSHFDSHRHVHFHRQIIPTFCEVAKEYRIKKFRRYSNVQTTLMGQIHTSLWRLLVFASNKQLSTTDYFCGAMKYMQQLADKTTKTNRVYEVMCHPGHPGDDYHKENDLICSKMKQLLFDNNMSLISYNEFRF